MTAQLTDLPSEILIQIVDLLPYTDLKSARLVCKQLYRACSDTKFVERERVVFYENSYVSICNPRQLLHSERVFCHFKFEDHTPLHNYGGSVWNHFGPNLKSLSFVRIKLSEQKLFGILEHCAHLQYLELSSCEFEATSESASCAANLHARANSPVSLNLESFVFENHLDRNVFNKIMKGSRNLKSLSVGGIMAKPPNFHTLPPRGNYICDINVLAFVIRLTQLRELRLFFDLKYCPPLSCAKFNRIFANTLSKIDDLRKFSTNIPVQWEIFSNKPNLEEVTLENVNITVLKFICLNLPNIRHLDVTTTLVSTADVKLFTHLHHLTSLRVSCFDSPSTQFVDEDVFMGLCDQRNGSLESLKIVETRRNVAVSPRCIMRLACCYPSLAHLDLESCDGVTDSSVQFIFWHLVSLKCLKLCDCQYLSDAGLEGCPLQVDPGDEENNNRTGYPITRLKGLQVLDLRNCASITGSAFRTMIFPELRELYLSGNKQISHNSAACLIRNNPLIQRLEMDDCVVFTDKFVDFIVDNLKLLRHIKIGKVSEISVKGLQRLKNSCRRVVLSQSTRRLRRLGEESSNSDSE